MIDSTPLFSPPETFLVLAESRPITRALGATQVLGQLPQIRYGALQKTAVATPGSSRMGLHSYGIIHCWAAILVHLYSEAFG